MDFYEQLVDVYKAGIDPDTNLLKKEVGLIDDAIAFIKYHALKASALGETRVDWFVGKYSFAVSYRQADGTDKTIKTVDLAELMVRSEAHFNAVRERMDQAFNGRRLFFRIDKDRSIPGDYTISLSWFVPYDEEDTTDARQTSRS